MATVRRRRPQSSSRARRATRVAARIAALRSRRRRSTSCSRCSACSGSCRRSASSSRRSSRRRTLASNGWWKIFSKPSLATWSNYDATSPQPRTDHARARRRRRRSRSATRCSSIVIGALAGYAFAWLEFPGRDWMFIVVIALLVVPLQMALIPMFTLYDKLGHLRHGARRSSSSTPRSGCRSRSSCCATSSSGSRRTSSSRRASTARREIRIFLRLILPLGLPAIASLAIFQFLWTWNDLLVALDVRPEHAADHGLDLQPAARVRHEHRRDRAGLVHVADHPARRVLRVPALLRAGPARRLGEVAWSRRGAARSSVAGSRRSRPTRRCGAAGSRRGDRRASGRTRIRPRCGAPRAAAIRQQRMRSESDGHLAAASFPGLALRERSAPRLRWPLARDARDRYHPRSTTSSRTPSDVRERSGWDASFRRAARRRIARRRRRVRARRRGPVRARARRDRAPRAARPTSSPSAVHAYEPHEYASRGRGRRRRDGGGDRMAERARRRRRGRLGPPPRAASPAAERPARVLLAAGPRAPSTRLATSERAAVLRELSAAVLSARAGVGRADRRRPSARDGFGVETESTNGARAGDLRHRLPQGLRRRTRCSRGLVDDHGLETHDRWIVLDADSTVPALTDDDAHALARGRRRRSGRSPPPTRSPGRSTLPVASSAAYVVHAERPHRVAARARSCRRSSSRSRCTAGGRSSSSR